MQSHVIDVVLSSIDIENLHFIGRSHALTEIRRRCVVLVVRVSIDFGGLSSLAAHTHTHTLATLDAFSQRRGLFSLLSPGALPAVRRNFIKLSCQSFADEKEIGMHLVR